MKSFTLRIDVPDDWQDELDTTEKRRSFLSSIQNAFDHYWSLASMGSVKAVAITPLREPSESELAG